MLAKLVYIFVNPISIIYYAVMCIFYGGTSNTDIQTYELFIDIKKWLKENSTEKNRNAILKNNLLVSLGCRISHATHWWNKNNR